MLQMWRDLECQRGSIGVREEVGYKNSPAFKRVAYVLVAPDCVQRARQ